MKKLHELTLDVIFLLLTLAACTDEAIVSDTPQPDESDDPNVCVLQGDDFRWEGNESRTALTIENNVAKFSWTQGDLVGILPDEGAQVYFTIPTPTETTNDEELSDEQRRKAIFDGGAWALKAESDYAAYYPFVEDYHLDRNLVPVSYTGQNQTGMTTAHLGVYDYMGARPVTTNANGGVTFDFDHVSALVLLKFIVSEANTALKSVTLTAPEGVTFTTAGTYDLTSPKENGFPITAAENGISQTMTVEVDYTTTEANEEVTVYFMCAPVDLSEKTVNVSVAYGDAEETFSLQTLGKNMQAGNGYVLDARGILAEEMTADELKTAVTECLNASMTDIRIRLAADAGVDMFKAIEIPLATDGIAAGSIALTISGADKVPYEAFCGEEYSSNEYYKSAATLKSVTLTDATEMDELAFYKCENLISFSAPKLIALDDLYCLKLTEVYLPSLQSLGFSVFAGCTALKTISLPELTSISQGTFANCYALETIYAPKVTEIVDCAFQGCNALTKLTLGAIESVDQGIADISPFVHVDDTKKIDLVLSPDQKVMTYDWSTHFWVAGTEAFDFNSTSFLWHTFKSITKQE